MLTGEETSAWCNLVKITVHALRRLALHEASWMLKKAGWASRLLQSVTKESSPSPERQRSELLGPDLDDDLHLAEIHELGLGRAGLTRRLTGVADGHPELPRLAQRLGPRERIQRIAAQLASRKRNSLHLGTKQMFDLVRDPAA